MQTDVHTTLPRGTTDNKSRGPLRQPQFGRPAFPTQVWPPTPCPIAPHSAACGAGAAGLGCGVSGRVVCPGPGSAAGGYGWCTRVFDCNLLLVLVFVRKGWDAVPSQHPFLARGAGTACSWCYLMMWTPRLPRLDPASRVWASVPSCSVAFIVLPRRSPHDASAGGGHFMTAVSDLYTVWTHAPAYTAQLHPAALHHTCPNLHVPPERSQVVQPRRLARAGGARLEPVSFVIGPAQARLGTTWHWPACVPWSSWGSCSASCRLIRARCPGPPVQARLPVRTLTMFLPPLSMRLTSLFISPTNQLQALPTTRRCLSWAQTVRLVDQAIQKLDVKLCTDYGLLVLADADHGSWFWMLIRHFAAAADRYPSPHRRMQDGDLQASQTMRQHQD